MLKIEKTHFFVDLRIIERYKHKKSLSGFWQKSMTFNKNISIFYIESGEKSLNKNELIHWCKKMIKNYNVETNLKWLTVV